MADCMPDLSHLSAEERAIIEEVGHQFSIFFIKRSFIKSVRINLIKYETFVSRAGILIPDDTPVEFYKSSTNFYCWNVFLETFEE